MKRFAAWIFVLFPAICLCEVAILKDFSKAREVSKQYQLPLVLVFTDGKVQEKHDLFANANVQEILKSSAIFVEIDFPERTLANSKLRERNRLLRKEYDIQLFPTWLLLDADKREITRMGSMGGKSPEDFATKLKKHLFDYQVVQTAVEKSGLQAYSLAQLKTLYQKAISLGCMHFTKPILDEGLKKDDGTFFLMEKYLEHLNEGNSDKSEARHLKKTLLKRDPENKEGVRLRLALLDVQAQEDEPEKAIETLTNFVSDYGKSDEDNLWRLHLVISEFFTRIGENDSAIEHAKESLKEAPKESKEAVESVIECLSE